MDKNMKNILIGLVVVLLLIGAYYFGSTSKNTTQSTANTQGTAVSEDTQGNVVTNNQDCLSIANNAIKDLNTARVLHAHLIQSTGICYYEITGQMKSGGYATMVDYGSDDNGIALCTNSNSQPFTGSDTETSCIQVVNQTPINAAAFHLIEAQYLAN